MNWRNIEFVVCPVGHVNICENGEKPKFCQECGMKIKYPAKIKRCKVCGRPITKDLEKLGNGLREEYKDDMCIECWIGSHPKKIEKSKVVLEEVAS